MHGPAPVEIIGFSRLLPLNNTSIHLHLHLHLHLPFGIPHTEDVIIALQPCFSSVIT
jgi:hypothetical protein